MKIAIVCGSPSSEMLAPFDDPDWKIWVLGNRCDRYPRHDKIFEVHDNLDNQDVAYPKWLVDKATPLVVGEKFPIKSGYNKVYPYGDIADEFTGGKDYLTSSSAYMLAYAMYYYPKAEIAIYGVDMAVDDHEYFWQRPCMEYWMGLAHGRGINVTLPDVSPLCKSSYVEGRDWGVKTDNGVYNENDMLTMATEHQKKIDELKQVMHNTEITQAMHNGAMQAYQRLAKVARAKDAKQDINSILDSIQLGDS